MAPRLSRLRPWLIIALTAVLVTPWSTWAPSPLGAAPDPRRQEYPGRIGSRPYQARTPGPTIEPFVRPELARRMQRLRPIILAAARRHNRPELSGMSDTEFAAVIALVIYNENFGWLEDDIAPLRAFTPLYQELQRQANEQLPGSNFSVWPTNLRPSVALEILEQELPLADSRVITVPLRVEGSQIDPADYTSREELFAAITAEISRDDLAVAYLAANLERGVYRAAHDGTPLSWRTLAAWHNQGITDPRAIRANPTARDYVRRASAYLPLAHRLVGPQGPRSPVTPARGRPL